MLYQKLTFSYMKSRNNSFRNHRRGLQGKAFLSKIFSIRILFRSRILKQHVCECDCRYKWVFLKCIQADSVMHGGCFWRCKKIKWFKRSFNGGKSFVLGIGLFENLNDTSIGVTEMINIKDGTSLAKFTIHRIVIAIVDCYQTTDG